MPLSHLTWSARGRLALFPREELRRAALRSLSRVAGAQVLLFGLADDHLHVVVEGPPGPLARAVLLALRPRAASVLDPAHVRPVEDRSHLGWLVGSLLGQPDKHGLPVHPALWTGSCFPDLVGARRLFPGMAGRLAAQLPRYRLRQAYQDLGLSTAPLQPADDDAARAAGSSRILAAAGAALAAGPDLSGKAAERVLARKAAAIVAAQCGIHPTEVAWAMGQPLRSARRLADDAVDPALLQAVRLRLALEDRAHRGG